MVFASWFKMFMVRLNRLFCFSVCVFFILNLFQGLYVFKYLSMDYVLNESISCALLSFRYFFVDIVVWPGFKLFFVFTFFCCLRNAIDSPKTGP